MLKSHQDAFGQLVADHHRRYPATEIIERDDGWIATSKGPLAYFAPFRQWPAMRPPVFYLPAPASVSRSRTRVRPGLQLMRGRLAAPIGAAPANAPHPGTRSFER